MGRNYCDFCGDRFASGINPMHIGYIKDKYGVRHDCTICHRCYESIISIGRVSPNSKRYFKVDLGYLLEEEP